MKQSIFLLAILLLAGLFLAACQGNGERNNVLPELQLQPYKEEAKASLTAYIEALEQDDYSEENWAAIESIANTGKENIDMAADKQGVDSALAAALDEIGLIEKENKETEGLAEYKENAKANLEASVEALDPGDYSEENWAAIEEIANTGKENIDKAIDKQSVDSALAAAKDEIGLVEKENRDFILTISVEETTLPRGEFFKVNVELENKSGVDHLITFAPLFWPYIPQWAPTPGGGIADPIGAPPLEPRTRLFEANTIIRNLSTGGVENVSWHLGGDLIPGKHELRLSASFYINWGKEDQQRIVVWSNPVMLTVTDVQTNDFELTISMEETTLLQGETFNVNVELKNISGEEQEITYNILFWPHIPGWDPLGGAAIDLPFAESKILEPGGVILGTDMGVWSWQKLGYYLEPGVHKLFFTAKFLLGPDRHQITVWSNTITLNVQ